MLHEGEHRLLEHGQRGSDAQQPDGQGHRKPHRVDIHLRRHPGNDAQGQVDECQQRDHGQGDPERAGEQRGAKLVQAHLADRLQEIPIHGKAVEAFHHGHEHHEVTIDDHEEQHGHVAEETAHRTDLSAGGRIEEGREVEPHLQADDLARQLDRGEDQPHREADRHADRHLLGDRAERSAAVDADDGLVGQHRLRAHGHQEGQADLGPDGDAAHREHRRDHEDGQHPEERPQHRREPGHDLRLGEGDHAALR